MTDLGSILAVAWQRRETLHADQTTTAYRLINGFSEKLPGLCVDRYRTTLVINDYRPEHDASPEQIREIAAWYRHQADWINAIVWKRREGACQQDKRGQLIYGDKPTSYVLEHGVKYAVDVTMNLDASFYLDTAHLRQWLLQNMQDKSVLNTFAYTGSLGVAAKMGGARHVTQTDLKAKFLEVAQRSMQLNGQHVTKRDIEVGDFWSVMRGFRQRDRRYECVILDPPYFSDTRKGRFDITKEFFRLLQKVKPVINSGGYLITVNNSLFLDGQQHYQDLQDFCADDYAEIEQIIPVPASSIGDEDLDWADVYPKNTAPYNHSTKITVIKIK